MNPCNSATDTGAPPDRIKLLKFLSLFAIGGTERQVINLVRNLDAARFELHFGCFRRYGQFLEEVEKLGIPIAEYDIRSLHNYQTMVHSLRFARFLKRRHIQLVHTYGFYSTVFAVPAAKLAGVPLIVTSIRDTGELLTPRQKKVQKVICRMADSVLVNADAVKNWLISEGFRPGNIQVIRNGIDLGRFDSKNDGPPIRQQLGLPPGAPIVAMCSRLNRLKGVEYFMEAAASVAVCVPQARFLIVGDTRKADQTYAQELKRKAAQLGLEERLLFTGFRLDVPQLLSQISVSVLPSLSEGLSNSLLESMAAGVPAIATNIGGNPEIVVDGVTGILVPPRDSAALARAMCALLQNPELAQRFGSAGRQRISDHFDLEKMVRTTEQHYLALFDREQRKHARRIWEAA